MSEQILLLNPRRKRRRHARRRRSINRRRMPAGLRRYWASHRRRPRRRRHNRRRAVARVGRPYRARRTRRYNRRRSYRRHRHVARRYNRRSFGGMRSMGRGIVGGYLIPGVVGGVGGLALDVMWGYVSPKLPATVQTGYAGLAAKLAVVVGAAWLMNRFVPRMRVQTHRAAVGASTVLLYGAIKGAAQSVLPAGTPGLSGYIDYQSYALPGARMGGYMPRAGLGSLEDLYSPAAVIQPLGTPVPRQFGHLSGYVAAQPHVGGGGGLMGYDWQNDGM